LLQRVDDLQAARFDDGASFADTLPSQSLSEGAVDANQVGERVSRRCL